MYVVKPMAPQVPFEKAEVLPLRTLLQATKQLEHTLMAPGSSLSSAPMVVCDSHPACTQVWLCCPSQDRCVVVAGSNHAFESYKDSVLVQAVGCRKSKTQTRTD